MPEAQALRVERGPLQWAALAAIASCGLLAGFVVGEDLRLGVAAAALLAVVFGFLLVPYAFSVKLVFLIIAATFLQRIGGYVRSGAVQGLNLGNALLALAVLYWGFRWIQTGRLYRPSPGDGWIIAAFVGFPLLSIYFTVSFRQVPGYALFDELRFLKQYATPVFYFLLVCQTLERKKEAVLLIYLLVFLSACAVLAALPETLHLKSWHETRAEGFVAEANRFGAFISLVVPFLFLALFLLERRFWFRWIVLGVLGGLAFSLVSTYSRSGYIGFALAFAGSLYVAYRGTRKLPITVPALILGAGVLLPLSLEPQIIDYIRERFEMRAYQREKRKSYDAYARLNEYSGTRLEIWRVAIEMSRDHPLVGAGFDAFPKEYPKYHARQFTHVPHNHFLGTLAQGGVAWLVIMAGYFYRLFQVLYQNWKLTLAQGDRWGQVICGGGLLSYVVMVWISLTLDFYYPGPQILIFWLVTAAAVRYVSLEGDPEPSRGRTPAEPAAAAAPG